MTNHKPLKIAVFGASNLDINATAEKTLMPGDSTPGRITTTAGGVARNIAENLARLGHCTHLISAVGDDLQGQFLLNQTSRAGVNTAGCNVLPSAATGAYLLLNQPDGLLLAAINDMQALSLLTPVLLAHHATVFKSAQAWVIDCNLSEVCMEWLMQNASDKPVFIDGVSSFKCVKVMPYLPAIHTLKINRLEASALTGLEVANADQAIAAAQHLCARGVLNAVVSMGNGGVAWCERGGNSSGHMAALAVAAVSSNGAGDALTSGLVHGALAGWPLEQSVRFANACAALTMTSSSANFTKLSVTRALQLLAQQ